MSDDEARAQECLSEALELSAEGTDPARETRLFREALELGLSGRDRAQAHAFLGSALIGEEQREDGIYQLESALELDAAYSLGFFDEQIFRAAFFPKVSAAYSAQAKAIVEDQGYQVAISYLEDKLQLFEYLQTDQLPMTHLDLGVFYGRSEQFDLAAKHFQKVLECEALGEHDAEIMNIAQENLTKLGF